MALNVDCLTVAMHAYCLATSVVEHALQGEQVSTNRAEAVLHEAYDKVLA